MKEMKMGGKQQARRRRARGSGGLLPTLAAAFSLMIVVLSPVPVQAQQQNEIVLTVDFDGTPAFSAADPLDDGAGGHTPGLDLNANNSVVRTWDQIQYRIDWNVNEVDGTTTTLRMTLPEGVEWLEDGSTVTGVPSGCADDGTSSITGNDGRDLVCVTDAEHEGSNGAIHPRALVKALLDDTPLTVDASVETDQLPAVVSNPITTVVSARPAGDWLKGAPILDADSGDVIAYEPDEEYFDIPNADGTLGRVFIWSLRLTPAGGLKGSEPMDDSVDIELWDHFFDSVPGTTLATPAQMLAATGLNRVACGGYDGADGYPYGVTDMVPSTTPAAQTNVGVWKCTDLSGASGGPTYPLVKVDITGHDTTNIAPQNANLSPNNSTLASGQIAFWAPNDQLIAKPVPRIIVNAITGSDAVVSPGDTEVDPILIHGTSGPLPEFSELGTGLAETSNNSPYEFPTSPPGNPGRSFRHYVRYQNAPYQEINFTAFNGANFQYFDTRVDTLGGTGRVVTNGADGVNENGSRWDGDGQTPRGNVLTVLSQVSTITSKANGNLFSEPIHLCTAVDTTHQSVIGMPASFPVFELAPYGGTNQNASTYATNLATAGGSSATPATQIAQVNTSVETAHTSVYWPNAVPGYRTDVAGLDYVIEVAAGTSPGNVVGINTVSCNEDVPVDGNGWVDATNGDLSVFETGTMADGTPIYGDITHLRVRTSGDVPWQSDNLNTSGNAFASLVQLNFQVQVKSDTIAQAADQELFVYSSRARGEWDGTGLPPTPSCTNAPRFGADDAVVPVGWCNLDFADDAAITGGDSTTVGTDFKNDFDASVVEFTDVNGNPRLAHADAVYIVEPQLAISKANTDGPADIVANGQTIEFEINPKVVGSSLDAIHDVTVSDTLPATMEFVQFTSPPSEGTCSEAGGTITCNYGNQVGGWGNLGEGKFSFEVLVKDAGANATLTNTATVTGNDSQTGDPKTPASAKASAFTGAPFEESGIEKAVSDHITTCFEAPGVSMDLGDCTVIAVDGAMVFTLDVENEGNVDLENYRVIDVLPHLLDASEPPAAGHPVTGVALTGDGRTPPSAFTGTVDFLGAVAPAGSTILYSADAADSISRDPAVADSATTWCDSPAGGTAVAAGLAAAPGTEPCPLDPSEVTAVHFDIGTLDKGATELLEIHLETVGATCGDIWTNNFGARTTGLLLPIRSNDVSVMAGFCDPAIAIEKATNGLDSDESTGATIVAGDPVTWTYVVENTGDVALAAATVGDSDAAVIPDCDVDGDGVLDGTNVIPLLIPGDQINCEASGVATAGQYMNNSTVSGNPVLPDFSDPAVDPSDPSTWPTDAAAYSEPLNPVTGGPALEDPTAEDPSHYIGVDPAPAIDIEKDTNGAQSDAAPGNPIVAGAAVTWTYVVANTGTAALTNAVVSDVDSTGAIVAVDCDIDGDGVFDGTDTIPLLVPGGTVACQSTGVAGPGPYSNNASVSGNMTLPTESCVCDPTDPTTWPTDPAAYEEYVDPVTGEPVTVADEDPSNYTGAEPGVDIEKDTNGVQSDEAPGESIAAGDPVTWTYVVVNTGATALLDATVADSDPAVVVDCDVDGDGVLDGTNVIPFMAVGASVTCEGTSTAALGPYSNTASVSGAPALPDFSDPDLDPSVDPADPSTWPTDPAAYVTPTDPDGNPVGPVTDEDLSHYTGVGLEPGIDIEKDTNGVQSDEAPGESIVAGDAVTWTYVVENTGNTALAAVTVADSDPAVVVDCDVDGDGVLDGTNVIPFLAVAGTVTCEGTGTAVEGAYMNTATVTGDPVTPDFSDPSVDPSDPSTWPTDPAAYGPAIGPDGAPLAPPTDADDSHYTGTGAIGSLGGVVWNDADGDGILDPGETIHTGAKVELLDANGDPVLDANGNPIVATTDANGAYVFPDLPPGEYRVRITAPDGTILTPGAGGDDDVDGAGLSPIITIGAGDDVRGIDAGLVPAPPSLAFTGSETTGMFAAALMLVALGGLLLLGTRRRRAALVTS